MEVEASCGHCGDQIEECDVCGQEFDPEDEIICLPLSERLKYNPPSGRGRLERLLADVNKAKYGQGFLLPSHLHFCSNCPNMEVEIEIS